MASDPVVVSDSDPVSRLAARDTALGDSLLGLGKISQTDLDRARRAQADTGRTLAEVLTGLGIVSERDIADAFADNLAVPVAQRTDYPAAPLYEDALLPAFLKTRRLLPVSEKDDRLVLAMADPMDDFAADAVAMKLGMGVERMVALPSELEEALESLYGDGRSTIEEIVDSLEEDAQEGGDDAERLRDLASEAPVIRLVSLLINESVERRASDIHIEPFENRLRVRYRVDGVM
ncbi:MAG: type II secretion system protein GspE, partial [Rhodospirillaceae bacterium]|nr:type II secretion system protein GspE [Rhodospirillaceae bacterium]